MLGNPTHLLDINLEIHHFARVFFGPPVAFPPDQVLRFFKDLVMLQKACWRLWGTRLIHLRKDAKTQMIHHTVCLLPFLTPRGIQRFWSICLIIFHICMRLATCISQLQALNEINNWEHHSIEVVSCCFSSSCWFHKSWSRICSRLRRFPWC